MALVTGGSRGIGLMIVAGLVANGATVFLTSRNQSACEAAADSINNTYMGVSGSGKAIGFSSDVSSIEGCQKILKVLKENGNRLDILVNNAGTNWAESIDTYPQIAFHKLYQLNVFGYFALSQCLLGLLESSGRASDPSRIINIGSVNGIDVPSMDTFAYSSSKAAVHHLSRVMASKLASRGITVNAIAPVGLSIGSYG